jgi:23S rRNA (adenine2503-C2)-methyltransferase
MNSIRHSEGGTTPPDPAARLLFEAPRRGQPPRHWADLTPAQRREQVEAMGHRAYRARQLSAHYFEGLRDDPADWTDLPSGVRGTFAAKFMPRLLMPMRELSSDGDTTVKTLWRMHDGALVESVLMRYPDRVTMCVSSQAGCGMACPFCATGQAGLQRNMSTAEIVEQVMDGERKLRRGRIPGGSTRVGNVVFMGMGEPLANYKAVLGAVRQLITPTPDGLGLSARGITVSTVGLVPRMQQLATEGIPLTLALSLHAPDDELRDELVPINTRWNVEEVVDAAWQYAKATKRRVSIEYILIRDINDQPYRAEQLAKVLRRRGNWGWVHVNLIPMNPTPGSVWTASRRTDEEEFVRRLQARGVPVTVRDTRGREIDGACGQLAAHEV